MVRSEIHAERISKALRRSPKLNASLERMHEAHRRSPRTAPGEANANAKEWRLRAPDGSEHTFRNLALFIRTHLDLFDPGDIEPKRAGRGTTTRASIQLGTLRPSEGPSQRPSWKGWRWLPVKDA